MNRYPSLESLLNEEFGSDRLDEVAGTLLVSAVLSIPAVMDGIARLLKKIGKKHHKEFAAVEKIEHASHELHNIYQKPVKMIINGSYRATHKGKKMDDQDLQKMTNIVFGIIVGYLAVHSSMAAGKSFKGAIEYIKKSGAFSKGALLKSGLGILETVLGTIEGIEEAHLIQAIKDPNHSEDFAHAIDDHMGEYDHKEEEKDEEAAAKKPEQKKENTQEGLSRGSLYRQRYYGRY